MTPSKPRNLGKTHQERGRRAASPLRLVLAIATLALWTIAALAPHGSLANPEQPRLLLRDGGATRDLPLAELDALTQVEITGRTSPDEPIASFQGVLLRDVVALIGAAEADQIVVRASDGYSAVIPREDWTRWPVVLATRRDGKPLTVRQRGPARILYPTRDHPELATRTYTDRSVWLVAEIEW